jgi:AcrR family transcriptional regulator
MDMPRTGKTLRTTRRERKKLVQKQEIFQAATRLFMEVGYEKATIETIAEAADISRATFFNYYPTKAALLHDIADAAIEHARRVFDKEFADDAAPAVEKIARSFTRFARIVERDTQYYETVFLEVMRSQSGFFDRRSDARPNLIDTLATHLEAEQRRGQLDASRDPTQLAEMLTGIYMYTIFNCAMQGFSYSLVARMRVAAEIFVAGCAPPPRAG